MRKQLAILTAGVASLALLVSGCSGGSGETATSESQGTDSESQEALEPIDVNFGYIADFNGSSLLAIAEDQGLWDEYALNVETSSFTNGPLQIQALGTGDLDFGYIGPGAMWLPASGKAKVVAINTLGQADRVIAQPGINSIEDLKGKDVAVPEGTSGDMILTLALEAHGMSKSDINVIPMDQSGIVTAFASGQVDAAGLWYPAISTLKEQIPDLVELAQNTDFEDTMAFPTAFVTSNEVAADDTEMVERVVAVLKEAIAWRYDNMDEAIALTAAYLQMDEDQVATDASNSKMVTVEELDTWTEDGTIDGWLTAMNDYFVSAEKVTDPVAPSEYYLGDLFLSAGE